MSLSNAGVVREPIRDRNEAHRWVAALHAPVVGEPNNVSGAFQGSTLCPGMTK